MTHLFIYLYILDFGSFGPPYCPNYTISNQIR